MRNEKRTIMEAAAALLLSVSVVSAGEVTFSGNATPDAGIVAVGTFQSDFDPYSYSYVYGIDAWGNMDSPNYSRAVADGAFRPIGTGLLSSGEFTGSGTASGIEDQQLWLFLFNDTVPDNAHRFALCTGSDSSWLGPADGASTHILGNTANQFVFGDGGFGAPLRMQLLPMPEPPTSVLSAFAALWGVILLLRNRRLAFQDHSLDHNRPTKAIDRTARPPRRGR